MANHSSGTFKAIARILLQVNLPEKRFRFFPEKNNVFLDWPEQRKDPFVPYFSPKLKDGRVFRVSVYTGKCSIITTQQGIQKLKEKKRTD